MEIWYSLAFNIKIDTPRLSTSTLLKTPFCQLNTGRQHFRDFVNEASALTQSPTKMLTWWFSPLLHPYSFPDDLHEKNENGLKTRWLL